VEEAFDVGPAEPSRVVPIDANGFEPPGKLDEIIAIGPDRLGREILPGKGSGKNANQLCCRNFFLHRLHGSRRACSGATPRATSKTIGYNQQYFYYKPTQARPQQPLRRGGIGYNR